MIKIGIIGGGYWGGKIEEKITALSQDHDLRLLFVAGRADDYLAMSRQHHIDWAVVTTPTESHRLIAADLLADNRNVFCTKPLTSSLEDSQYLVEIAEQCGSLLYIDDVFTYHAGFSRVRELSEEDRIHIFWNKWNGKEFSSVEDALFRLCYHDLYLIEELIAGQKPVLKEYNIAAGSFRLNAIYGEKEVAVEYSVNTSLPEAHRINNIDFTHRPGDRDALQQMLLTALTSQFNQQRNNDRGLWVNRQLDELLGQLP